MAQWSRVCLPMQETWIRPLIQEDPTCHGATKPVHHTIEPVLWRLEAAATEACVPLSLCSTTRGATAVRRPCTTARE